MFGPMIGIAWLPLMLLMFVIEMISHIARPLSLGIRLMANMTADHLVLTIFLGLVPFLVPLPMYVLGAVVVVVQALVFSLLSTVYIGMAIEESETH
jgi:F-type H+-transporting ATPase subunit a